MLLRCLVDHQVSQNETQHFEPGKVYRFEGPAEDLGRRLLQDFGRNSQHVARHNEPKFERVLVEGDTIPIVVQGETQQHAVTADEAYSGEVIEVTPQGLNAPGASGEVDHSHHSQSEPEQPPYGGEKLQQLEGDEATEQDHTTATQGASGTGAPMGQVGSGQPGDVLSPTAPQPHVYTSESNAGFGEPSGVPASSPPVSNDLPASPGPAQPVMPPEGNV